MKSQRAVNKNSDFLPWSLDCVNKCLVAMIPKFLPFLTVIVVCGRKRVTMTMTNFIFEGENIRKSFFSCCESERVRESIKSSGSRTNEQTQF
jgi:hypothetical protein